MKKCYQIIIFFAILAYFNSETLKCDGEIPTNREDCWNLFTVNKENMAIIVAIYKEKKVVILKLNAKCLVKKKQNPLMM